VRDRLAEGFESFVVARPTLCVDEEAFELLHIASLICHRTLSAGTIRLLKEFGQGCGPTAILIENLPQPRVLPPTPCETGFVSNECELLFPDGLQLGLLAVMGVTPMAHAHENQSRLFRNVVPKLGSKNARSSWGSSVPFDAHVDNPNAKFIWERLNKAWPPVPPVLAFMGLRNEDANGRPVPTSLIPLTTVLAQLQSETIEVLCQPDFLISSPDSNDDNQSIKAAILVRDPVHGDHIRFDAGVTEGLNEPANVALDKLKAVLRGGEGRVDFRVRGGCAAYFWNTQYLHQRSAYSPGPSEVARWLRRCYATPDLYAGHIADRRRLVWSPEEESPLADRLFEAVHNGHYSMTGL